MVSELLLDFPENTSTKTLRISDASFYNPKIDVTCATIEVIPPGYLEPVTFNVKAGFSIVLNSSNLKLAKVKVYKALKPLPDGIYNVKYSVNPNEKLWIEYDILRVDQLMHQYYKSLCAAKLTPYPHSKEVRAEIKRLREIRTYIDWAKAEVQECGNRIKGLELYKYAKELISEQCKTCQ